jgi:EAL domain-containing protein (putative c-di-GMP-specific phosphodiesterase class I)
MDAPETLVQRPATEEIDYRQLRMATMEAGRFAPVANNVWFLTGRVNGGGGFRYVPINTSPFRVGRRSDLTLCLPCATVSSLHAEIVERGEELYVRDLGSTNGTFINGQSVTDFVRVGENDLVQFANVAMRVNRQSHDRDGVTAVENVGDQALALTRFDDLLSERAVVPHFQPIVRFDNHEAVGYEVLGRSRLFGLNSPREMFFAAEQLNLETELSRMLRQEGVAAGQSLPENPRLFVNTHPLELKHPAALVGSLEELRRAYPDQPITLEIHEAAACNTQTNRELRDALTSLGMELAYDDFGAGQARFLELAEVPPHVLKFDITLIQGIHEAGRQRQNLLATLLRMTHDLGIVSLAEGVECEQEADACRDFGFQLAQGFFFGKPATTLRYTC